MIERVREAAMIAEKRLGEGRESEEEMMEEEAEGERKWSDGRERDRVERFRNGPWV